MRPDRVSLGAGLVIAALGALLLLDASEAVEVPIGWMAMALTAGAGLILLIAGLDENGSDRHD